MIENERREKEEEHCAKDQRGNNCFKHCNTPLTDSVYTINELNCLERNPSKRHIFKSLIAGPTLMLIKKFPFLSVDLTVF